MNELLTTSLSASSSANWGTSHRAWRYMAADSNDQGKMKMAMIELGGYQESFESPSMHPTVIGFEQRSLLGYELNG